MKSAVAARGLLDYESNYHEVPKVLCALLPQCPSSRQLLGLGFGISTSQAR